MEPPGATNPMNGPQGPLLYEDLHRRVKELQPMVFDGIRLMLNRPLSPNFQLSHSMSMGSMSSSYRFGANYMGPRQLSPSESYPIMASEIDCDGQLNANFIHLISPRIKARAMASFSKTSCSGSQLTFDYKGDDYTSSLTLANIDLVKNSGVAVCHFLQQLSKSLSLGTELVYQFGSPSPRPHMAALSLAGRYSAENNHWNATLSSSGAHISYFQKASEHLQFGSEFVTDLSMSQSNAAFYYQCELSRSNILFRGTLDTAWNVGAVLEKKFFPLPVSLIMSAVLNHPKNSTTVGVGLTVG